MARLRKRTPPKAPTKSTKSGFTLEAFVEDVLSGDEDDDEVVLGGPTAGAKRSPDGGAAATAKMATRAKARATNRTIAPVMQADEGENPKTPPKSGFPFATFVEDVRSGDEDEDEFVFEGPATKAKGGRARNTIATQGQTADDPAPPPRCPPRADSPTSSSSVERSAGENAPPS